MKRSHCLIALLVLPLSILAAAKYPFPQGVRYAHGIKTSGITYDAIQYAFMDFQTRLYEESGDKARIKWDTPTQTVSEGIGYGMLIMVYMDNARNNTRAKFDKLWKYYNSFLDGNGLMNWKINGFSGIASENAATDAELDVAVALMEAYKQWGDATYLNDAKNLIAKIHTSEVNGNGYLKPPPGRRLDARSRLKRSRRHVQQRPRRLVRLDGKQRRSTLWRGHGHSIGGRDCLTRQRAETPDPAGTYR